MLIKFKAPDPRAGMTVRMDSHRGTHFVDTGAAVQLKEDGSESAPAPAPAEKTAPAPAPAEKTALAPAPAEKPAKAKK